MAVSAARQVARAAPHLERLDVLTLAEDVPPGRVEASASAGVLVHRVGRAVPPEESAQLLCEAARHLLQAHRHQVCHGHFAVHAGQAAVAAARLCGVPSVVSLRGNDLDRAFFHGPRHPLLAWTVARADAVVAVTEAMARRLGALLGRHQQVTVVHNGVDGAVFRPGVGGADVPLERPRPFLGFCGELRLKKGLPVLQELAARLAAREWGTLFWLGGVRGEEKAAVEAWARREPAAAARTCSLPYRAQPELLAARYAAMDALLFPSLWDGLPNALLEAMACARPVVVSDAGGLGEVVEHGRSGVVVPAGRLDRFVPEVEALLAQPEEQRRQMGEAARARVLDTFTPERECSALLGLWRRLAARSGA